MSDSLDGARIVREIDVPDNADVTMRVEKTGSKMRVHFDGVAPDLHARMLAANLFAMGLEMLMQDLGVPAVPNG